MQPRSDVGTNFFCEKPLTLPEDGDEDDSMGVVSANENVKFCKISNCKNLFTFNEGWCGLENLAIVEIVDNMFKKWFYG